MAGASRTNDDTAGGIIRPLQTFVRLNGQPWAVVGSSVDPHDPCWVPDPPHCSAVMAEGAPHVRINGAAACRAGDLASCGHPATGQNWIRA